jgi:hypothetical protein
LRNLIGRASGDLTSIVAAAAKVNRAPTKEEEMFVIATRERLRSLASMMAGLALLSGVVATWSGFSAAPTIRIQLPSSAEATSTTAFVTALAHGDEATADQVASPLYHAEWTRRGLSVRDRTALARSSSPSSLPSSERLHFTFIGQVDTDQGFRHLLYVARPANDDPAASPTVWRIDTDPRGQVIWAEMVFLFDPGSAPFAPVGTGKNTKGINLPSDFPGLEPRVVMGVRSTTGREGYYAVKVSSSLTHKTSGGASTGIGFFGVDEDGVLRPGVWSYGQAVTAMTPYGQTARTPIVIFDPKSDELRQSYLSVLEGLN